MHGEFGLDFELPRHGGEALHESTGEDPVATEHVADVRAECPADDAVEEAVAALVTGPVGRPTQSIGSADAEHVIVRPGEQRLDHRRARRRVVGVVAVDQQIDVGFEVAEGASHDVALALHVLDAHDRARLTSALAGGVGAAVVVDVDVHRRHRGAQLAHDLPDGRLLVVARHDRRDAQRPEISSRSGLGRRAGTAAVLHLPDRCSRECT